ncbi:TrkH family potassium uptake protein [Bacillus sp. V3B]|uniref:TrkH family potassium uptake protein n=1 Tax=Bacillus sp. V3B TaxID=2804915 RepID=UPI00210A80CD|nr:potassium transporter TrkG [Bacillus sp. V3B]MCQ6275558.1 TrkH family potassium uptake protein [Bacillus sp. V3B]
MLQNKSTIRAFRYIFFLYISMIICFSFLYIMPFSQTGQLSYIDSLFVSTSGLSVTGLSTIDITKELTRVGQTLLIIEMQLGGIGILVIISYLFLVMGKKITMSNMLLISKDQNQSNLKTIKSLSFSVLIITLMIETICFLFIYSDINTQYSNAAEAIFVSVFHSVASFTNAGFSLIDLEIFEKNNLFLFATTAAIFLGSIGFPTIMEYIFSFKKKKSLFAKINIRMHLVLLIIGSGLYILLEYNKAFSHLDFADKITNSIFLSASTRSGGLATFDISSLTITTLLILMCLMFIGGASSSTGGGIRLTTFRVIIAKVVAVVRTHEQVVIEKRAITEEAVNKSFFIFFSFVSLTVVSTTVLTLFESENVVHIAFEVLSALTNTGLSMGMTNELTNISKIILMFLMVVGRIGIFTLIYFVFRAESSKIKYLEEDIAVG